MRLCVFVALAALIVGCDKKGDSPPTGGNPQVARAKSASPVQSQPEQFNSPVSPNPADVFPVFAAEFLKNLMSQYIGAGTVRETAQPGVQVLTLLKPDTAKIDVKKTDSLLNPVVGVIVVRKYIYSTRQDVVKDGSPASTTAIGAGEVEDTMSFAVKNGQWQYIGGRSCGELSKQDAYDVSRVNREGISKTILDEDLARSKIILDAVVETNNSLSKKIRAPSP